MDDSTFRFVAGCCALGIGCLHVMPLLQLVNRMLKVEALGTDFPSLEDNFLRATFMGSGILGFWVGVRLAQTARVPEWSAGVLEMGWAYLIAMAVGSAIFIKRSWHAKWVFALGFVGCCALYFAGLDS